MTRSFKHTPICGHTKAESDKEDKRRFNRRNRRKVKSSLSKHKEDFDGFPEKVEHHKNGSWYFAKDGKQYIGRNKIIRK